MKSNNPVFGAETFQKAAENWRGEVMTLDGTATKVGILGVLLLLGAAWSWHLYAHAHVGVHSLLNYLWIGGLGGFVVALITIFNKQASPITAPMYAVLEGLALGAASLVYESQYPGIGIEAVGLTFAVLGAFLFAYNTGLVKPTQGFMRVVTVATAGIACYYLVAMGLLFFGMHAPMIWDTGIVGIIFSLFVTTVAALNLFLDFDFIEAGVKYHAPKYMEWYGAFGLMVTIVWLYLEMLRLLSKLRK